MMQNPIETSKTHVQRMVLKYCVYIRSHAEKKLGGRSAENIMFKKYFESALFKRCWFFFFCLFFKRIPIMQKKKRLKGKM